MSGTCPHAGVGAPIDLGLHHRASAFNLVHGLVGDNCGGLSAQNLVRRLVGGTGGTLAEGFTATTFRLASLQQNLERFLFGGRGTNLLYDDSVSVSCNFCLAIVLGG